MAKINCLPWMLYCGGLLLFILFRDGESFQSIIKVQSKKVLGVAVVVNPNTHTRLYDSTIDDQPQDDSSFQSITSSTQVERGDGNGDGVPAMDWLTQSLNNVYNNNNNKDNNSDLMSQSPYMEEHGADGDLGDVPIPTTGISVSDEMAKTQKDRFFTELVPIRIGILLDDNNNDMGVRVAQMVTTATAGSFEPVRYIIGLDKRKEDHPNDDRKTTATTTAAAATPIDSFAMIDVPPYSEQLKSEILNYMGPNGRLTCILVTSRDCIHYDDAPGVFSIQRADLKQWQQAFSNTAIIAYRLDIPRDCRELITQRLDGYGPFALDEKDNETAFIETGRPLTYQEWDFELAQDILAGKQTPPDDSENDGTAQNGNDFAAANDDKQYTPEAIRSREKGKRILAVYTPGHSYGSVSYVFPELQLCVSGFTIPVEDNRAEENVGLQSAGPALDCRGYITTSRAGITRQMKSARDLISNYVDRFNVVLPSRGDPFFLDGNAQDRKQELLSIIDQYEKIGQIYEQLGITSYGDKDDDEI